MIYHIGTQKLFIADAETKEDKGTPHQVVSWRDCAETCKILDAVCNKIETVESPKIVDGIARAGFWAALFKYKWTNCKLYLNEQEEKCNPTLIRNFPEARISNHDVNTWAPKRCDIAMLDFDNFTLRTLDKWLPILQLWENSCTHLLFVDSACFGFKFGNMKHYGVATEQDYYIKLNSVLTQHMSKRITYVSKFNNAAAILMENKKGSKIQFLEASTDIFLHKGILNPSLF